MGSRSWTIPLGTADLSNILDPVGDLLGSLITPVSNFLSSQLGFIFEPILEDVAAETLRAAIEALTLDTTIDVSVFDPAKVAPVDVKAELRTVSFTEEGGSITLEAGAWSPKEVSYDVLGSIQRDFCAGSDTGSFAFSENVAMGVGLNMDFVNEFLFSAWWNGVLDTEIPHPN